MRLYIYIPVGGGSISYKSIFQLKYPVYGKTFYIEVSSFRSSITIMQ